MVPMSNRVRRVGYKKSVPNRKNSPPLKKKLLAERIQDELQESLTGYGIGLLTTHQLSCLLTESDLKQKLEEAKAEAEFYKFKYEIKEEELDELRHSEEELLDELKRAKKRAKLNQRLTELLDAELRLLLDEDGLRRHAPAAAAVEEAFSNQDEITCCPETRYPTAVCSRCRDEEACVVVLPCNHLSLCLACELETDRCPDCHSTKSGWFWRDVSE